jgi:hypothetical protein
MQGKGNHESDQKESQRFDNHRRTYRIFEFRPKPKIRGGIEVDPRWSSTCTVTFTYYFSPTPNDRNLEWDMKKNLFGGLTDMQTPREP